MQNVVIYIIKILYAPDGVLPFLHKIVILTMELTPIYVES